MTTQLFQSGGIQLTMDFTQIIYLDFDGELTTYNGEILTVDEVKVQNSNLTQERIQQITAALNEQFAGQNVQFVSDRSELSSQSDYSTIYIGKTSSFEPYGNFAGLAETVDSGNKIRNDKAFVMLDSTNDNIQIIETIAHEVGHLLGSLDHGGEGLQKYGFIKYYNQTYTGTLTSYLCLDYIYPDSYQHGEATPVYYGYDKASNATIASGGTLNISYYGTANNIILNAGGLLVNDGGVATGIHGSGGAIVNRYGSGSITISDHAVFSGNSKVYGSGGAILNCGSGSMTIGDSAVFSGNSAATRGGAILNYGSGSMTIGDSAVFSGNSAATRGGAIVNLDGHGGMTIGDSIVFSGNSAGDFGGAIYNDGSMTIGDFAVFSGNSARFGGAIYYYNYSGGSMTIGDSAVFFGNSAVSSGGAIFNRDGMAIGDFAVFSGNSAGCGGAIYNSGGSMTIGDSAVFSGNSAGSGGRAIYNSGGSMTIGDHAVFSGNNGCAIYYFNYFGGSMTIGDHAVFSGNNGCAIYNSGGSMTIGDHAVFSGNNGGAIYNYGSMTIGDHAVFSGNNGGAIYNSGSMTIGDFAVFSGNSAGSGGAIYNYHSGCSMTIGDSAVFSGNSAGFGGAIYYYNYSGGSMTIGDSAVFSGNSAGYGGAIYNCNNSGGSMVIGDSAVFSGNSAGCGGAIYYFNYSGGSMTIGDFAVFSGNSAGYGGAICNDHGSMYLCSAVFTSNVADSGGAIYNQFGGSMTLSNCVFETSSDTIYTAGGIMVTGRNVFAGAITITGTGMLENNGTIVLDVSSRTKGQAAMISDWTRVSSAYTSDIDIRVSGDMKVGTYQLIDNVDSYTKGITVYSEKDYLLGNLSVGGVEMVYEGQCYTLVLKNKTLSLSVYKLDREPPVITLTGDTETICQSTALKAESEKGIEIFYSTDLENWTLYEDVITVTANGTYYFKAADAAGNIGTNQITFNNIMPAAPENLLGNKDGISWSALPVSEGYIAEYSTDSFVHSIQLHVAENELDTWNLPSGTYQWRVRIDDESGEWAVGEDIVSNASAPAPQSFESDADNVSDVFFGQSREKWTKQYAAQHVGSVNDWIGTQERISLLGKNKITDVFCGSTDANILFLTDDANGDALFVDDIYTAFPEEQQSRIAQINEIRSGDGDDIVDMTSQRFEYNGSGVTIRGGSGNDTIWANKGNNILFGDSGNDRIVGASGDDVIVGGIGNDSMHGGGGEDIFCFCNNWGWDTVKQLSGGSVTLWFASGNANNWNQDTLIYSDGTNRVKVTGVTADKITLKFGDDSSDQFDTLTDSGAFNDISSEKIFEEKDKGVLASL